MNSMRAKTPCYPLASNGLRELSLLIYLERTEGKPVQPAPARWRLGMRLATPDWTVLALFTGIVLCATLFGLALSAHFPAKQRRLSLRGPVGNLVLWGTIGVSMLAALAALRLGLAFLPGYAAVIAGGAAILVAPLLLKPLPDQLIDDRGGLLMFAVLAALLASFSAAV